MEIVIIWFIVSIVIAFVASSKGRSGFGWFFVSLLISPVIALLILLIIGSNEPAMAKQRHVSGTHLKCPSCAEEIKAEAKVCKHCGRDVPTVEAPEPDQPAAPVTEEQIAAAKATLRDQYQITTINPTTGEPPLIAMARQGNLEAVQLLVVAGADKAANYQGFTAADTARMAGNQPIFELVS